MMTSVVMGAAHPSKLQKIPQRGNEWDFANESEENI